MKLGDFGRFSDPALLIPPPASLTAPNMATA